MTEQQVLGTLEGIYTTDVAGAEMIPHEEICAVAGVGLEGDRYSRGLGRYSGAWHDDRQATFIAAEVLEDLSISYGIPFAPEECRRNFVTRGLSAQDLKDLIGKKFRIGEVVFYGGRENVPCKYLERLTGKPVFDPLVGRTGLNAQILEGGTVEAGKPLILIGESADE